MNCRACAYGWNDDNRRNGRENRDRRYLCGFRPLHMCADVCRCSHPVRGMDAKVGAMHVFIFDENILTHSATTIGKNERTTQCDITDTTINFHNTREEEWNPDERREAKTSERKRERERWKTNTFRGWRLLVVYCQYLCAFRDKM